jgi:hypothetical protein
MNVARHLLVVLLVPDKRGLRNLTAAVGLGLRALLPGLVLQGSVLSITVGLLFLILIGHLAAIGWATVRDDVLHPVRTGKMMLRN